MKKKFFIIINDLGSYSNFLYEVANELKKEYLVYIVCSNNRIIDYEDNRNNHGINFINVQIPRSFNLFNLFKASYQIKKVINLHKPDFVHSHFLASIISAILFGKKHNIKYIATFHGLESYTKKYLIKCFYLYLEKFISFRYDRTLVLNNDDFAILSSNKKVYKLTDFGIGCDVTKFSFNNSNHFSINESNIVIGFVGRFVEFKGFSIICQLYKLIKRSKNNKFKFILLGSEDPRYKSRFISESLELMKKDESVIMPGTVNNVENYLSRINIFVFPSIKEGVPVSVMEAMSFGIPVIAFKVRGLTDLINNFEDGILLDFIGDLNSDAQQIYNTIVQLQNDEKLFNKIRNTLLLKRNLLSRKNFVEQQVKFYKTI
jgi:glycosyltransferase involved in cell wall biosynthesis